MARRVDAQQLTAAQLQDQAFVGIDDAICRNRQDVAIDILDVLGAIDSRDTGHQLGRLGHMAAATRMDHQLRIREFTHQRAGTAGVVEVDVR